MIIFLQSKDKYEVLEKSPSYKKQRKIDIKNDRFKFNNAFQSKQRKIVI